MPPGSAKLDPDLKTFRDLVQSGITPTAAYRRVYAATRNISDQAAYAGGLRKMSQLNLLNPQSVSLNSTTQHAKKSQSQPVDDNVVIGTKAGLIKRLWKTVINGKDEASTNAAVKLFAWYENADQQSADAARPDPAMIARHLCYYDARVCDASDLQAVLDGVCSVLRVTPDQVRCYRMPQPQTISNPIINDLQQEPQKISDSPQEKAIPACTEPNVVI